MNYNIVFLIAIVAILAVVSVIVYYNILKDPEAKKETDGMISDIKENKRNSCKFCYNKNELTGECISKKDIIVIFENDEGNTKYNRWNICQGFEPKRNCKTCKYNERKEMIINDEKTIRYICRFKEKCRTSPRGFSPRQKDNWLFCGMSELRRREKEL